MKIAVAGSPASPGVAALVETLLARARVLGNEIVATEGSPRLVLNLTSIAAPRAHWRREGLHQFAVSVVPVPGLVRAGGLAPASEVLGLAYPALLQTLSNAVIAVDEISGGPCALVTPELGVRALDGTEAVLNAILPLAASTFAIENEVADDLPGELAASPVIGEIREGGRRLAAMGLLPSVVRLEEILSQADLKLLRAVFGLQQISYGNLSAREPAGGFWMTGRGVDKSNLGPAGRDVLLVTGHDEERGLLRVRVPAGEGTARASVDALEHALIYAAFPRIGAIVHAHAWLDGIASTRQNWPCGTVELARDVRDLVSAQADPGCAEVGLRNHGVTLCGSSVASIFERVAGRIRREVPAA